MDKGLNKSPKKREITLRQFLGALSTKRMTWRSFIDTFVIVGIVISLYVSVYVPWTETKPDLEFHTTSHYIGNNTAITLILIRNKGNAPATNMGIYFEFERSYTIKEIRSNLEYNLVEGGEGDWRVEMAWGRLESKNSLSLAVFIEADPADISSVFPVILRVWSDMGVIEAWCLRS